MPSQEDYLDKLLKNMAGTEESGDGTDNGSAIDLDILGDMSEQDIDQLFATEDGQEKRQAVSEDDDVLRMLQDSDDSDLMEIHELLRRSDSNEPVDGISDRQQDDAEDWSGENFSLDSAGEEPAVSGTAAARKAKKQAAREAKAAARAQKAAAREAAKAARAAQKAEKAVRKKAAGADKLSEQKNSAEADGTGKNSEAFGEIGEQDEDLFNMSILDSIVSGAGAAGRETGQEEEKPAEQTPDLSAESQEDLTDEFPEKEDIDLRDIKDLDLEEDAGLSEPSEQEKPQKKSVFSKFLDFLTEEDENEDIKLSQENQDILDDLDQEAGAEKGKKKKKAEKKKDKKAKNAGKAKKPQPKKKKDKPKKEKAPREESPYSEKKLPFKKMLPIFLIGFSFGALLILFVNVIADYSDKRAAREAFYEGDYRTCYQNLFGKKLDETESIMYGKSRSILYIRLWLREYEMFVEEGSELQALDSLIQTVDSYPELYEYAGSWNATEEVAAGYATVLNILADKYGLSESDAKAIAGERSNVEYTRKVTAVVEGKYQGSGNSSESSNGHGTAADNPAENPENSSDEVLPDLLPEEDGLGQDNFLDNE